MDRDFNSIVDDALSLDAGHRGELVDKLIVSLSKEEKLFAAHLTEAKRRLDAYDRGEITARDAKDVMADIRKLRQR